MLDEKYAVYVVSMLSQCKLSILFYPILNRRAFFKLNFTCNFQPTEIVYVTGFGPVGFHPSRKMIITIMP